MDNLKTLQEQIEQQIDPNGTPGSILAVNHQSILKQVLATVGKWTGSAFVAQKNATVFTAGTFSWNNNALNNTSDFVITTSKKTADLNDFGRVLNTMVSGDLIRFKDFNGRSVFLNYKSHTNALDASGNPTWNITVNGFVDNPNYIYQVAETSIAIVSVNKTTGISKTYVDDQDDAFLVLAKQYTDEQIAGVIQPRVIEFALNHQQNLDFVPFMRWHFPGNPEFTQTKAITLTASDPSLDRIDVIAGDNTGEIVVIQGTPASEPAKPEVNPDTQIEATFVLIKAGATAPDGVTRSTIYNENTQTGGGEWNTSKNAGTRIDLASTVDVYSGTVGIEGTAMNNLDAVEFVPPAPIAIADFPELKLWMKNKDDVNPADPFRIQIIGTRSNGKTETLFLSNPSSVGYSPTSLVWQQLNFGVSSSTIVEVTKVRWVNYASNADQFGMFLDVITYSGGTNVQPPPPATVSISIRDENGVEKFKISDFVRFGNMVFDSALKKITPDFSNLVAKVTGKSLIADTEISRLANLNDRFKGKFTSLSALQTAVPTANAGDYAQVDTGASNPVSNYNWDIEDGWVVGSTGGSGATNTDELVEGSSNLYFTGARVLATILSGLSLATGGAIVSTDSVLIAFGKIQKQINDLTTSLSGKQATLVSGTNIKSINGTTILGSGDMVIDGGGGTSIPPIQNEYADTTALLANQGEQTLNYFQYVTDASGDPAINSGWAIYQKLSTSTGSLSNYRLVMEGGNLTANFAKLDSENEFLAKQFIKNELSVGTGNSSTTNNFKIVDTNSGVVRIYELKALPSAVFAGYHTQMVFKLYYGNTEITAFKLHTVSATKANVQITGDLVVDGSASIAGALSIPKVALTNRVDDDVMTWNNGSLKTIGSNPKYLEYRFNNGVGGGWHAGHRFYAKNGGAEALLMTLVKNSSDNVIVEVHGEFKTSKLNLSNLGSYANDAGASAGGVAVGYAYINSSTGAVHRRLV